MQCAALIAETEAVGYTAAMINTGGGRQVLDTDVRKSGRVIVDSNPTATDWFGRIAPHLPTTLRGPGLPGAGGQRAAAPRKLAGLNERLRYLRYYPGEYFAPHNDGSYRRPDGSESSMLTMMLYLNSGGGGGDGVALTAAGTEAAGAQFGGGETNFLDWRNEDRKASVVPEVHHQPTNPALTNTYGCIQPPQQCCCTPILCSQHDGACSGWRCAHL